MHHVFFALLALIFSSSALAADRVIVGVSVDQENFDCENAERNAQLRIGALEHLRERIRMQSGICAWHSGYLFVKTEPSISWTELGNSGCKVTASVIAECQQ